MITLSFSTLKKLLHLVTMRQCALLFSLEESKNIVNYAVMLLEKGLASYLIKSSLKQVYESPGLGGYN